jgi:hypothetical protein
MDCRGREPEARGMEKDGANGEPGNDTSHPFV